MSLFKIASLLLQYPDAERLGAREEIAAAAAGLPSGRRERVERFIEHWRTTPALELQEGYVVTFDFDKRASLNLSYHLYGDMRQRGIALLRLKRHYAAAGLPLAGGDLPDYLPLMLEFAALASREAAEEALGHFRPAIELVRARLHETGSPHAGLLDAVCEELPAVSKSQRRAIRRIAAAGPPAEQVGLDPFTPEPGSTGPEAALPAAIPAGAVSP